MTPVLITIDTELSARLHQQGVAARDNLACSVTGACAAGAFGTGWQMDRLEAAGLRGVFFVDPMPALVYGDAIIVDIVGPIAARGHDVQLHLHTEWLQWAVASPVGARRALNLGDLALADQVTLLRWGADAIARTGVPRPTAFRAGNYGANDDSLRALAMVGLRWDSSLNHAWRHSHCQIQCPPDQIGRLSLHDICEVPVSGLLDRPGRFRPAQICALSSREMRAALHHAAINAHDSFVIVTHSFEMLSRDRRRPNRRVMARFESMCAAIARHPALIASGFDTLDPAPPPAPASPLTRLGPSVTRTAARMAEQVWANWRYDRRLRPV
jgi:hypothetical protein